MKGIGLASSNFRKFQDKVNGMLLAIAFEASLQAGVGPVL
jgi:hypothetical protein